MSAGMREALMDDLLSEFLEETAESLDIIDVELVKFESQPNNAEILDNIFRLVHTIKGTCGFLGLPRLAALAHAAETLMGKYRDGAPVTEEGVSLILATIDRLKEILADLEENQAEPEGDDQDLISRLEQMALGSATQAPETSQDTAAETSQTDSPSSPSQETVASSPAQETMDQSEGTQATSGATQDGGAGSDALFQIERELKPGEVSLEELERAFQEAEGPDGIDISPQAAAEFAQQAAKAADNSQNAQPPAGEDRRKEDRRKEIRRAEDKAKAAKSKKEPVKSQSIRVNVETLEHLMTMVSELVLTRNQLLEIVRRHEDSEFAAPLQRLSAVTADLQEGVMKTRMQPIGNAWQKLPRVVRDLSRELNKKIELEMIGAETELDRQVLEVIKDPLTHMVRNSADHGLEDNADRLQLGKPEVGRIVLSAYHEGGQIIIKISDDGRGIDIEKLKAKILEKELATEEELANMSEAQIQRFIFHPGFSTASKVTSVSGRGVGMDVVRTNLELIGGTVDLTSVPGKGTTFTIKIPLTLAIVSALIIAVAGQRFAIPQLSVVELVRAHPNSEHRIELINDTPLLRLRNKLLPVIDLKSLLGLENASQTEEGDAQGQKKDESNFVVVTQVGAQVFGIVVDSVFHTEEIVVEPMSSMLRDISLFSGNTILGDGSVIMIIDPNGIAQTLVDEGGAASDHQSALEAHENADSEAPTTLLVFRAGSDEPKAVPLSLVTRLEEIPADKIERANGRDVVQYRGALMPIVYVDQASIARREETGVQPLLVFTDGDRSMGLAVDEIDDIVEEVLDIEIVSDMPGIIGTAVVQGKATEILDVGYYLPQAFDDWLERKDRGASKIQRHLRLLLVDDSAFFRNMLAPLLSSIGYRVTLAESAEQALELKEKGAKFDLIVSDIEMPGMDGISFAEHLKDDIDWGNIPIIALSSHADPEIIARSRSAGFRDYVGKFDREGLISSLKECQSQLTEQMEETEQMGEAA